MYPPYTTSASQHSRQEGFNSSQGASSRDVADVDLEVVAMGEAKVVDTVDAYITHTRHNFFVE